MTISAVAAMVATTTGAALPARIKPSISHDFPDPTVMAVGDTYYAYSTASWYGTKLFHVPVLSSPSLTGAWSHARDAMPELPAWVDHSAAGDGSVWAPAVTARDHHDYLLYFTAQSASQHTHCIGVARAWAPQGPFSPIGSHPLVCRLLAALLGEVSEEVSSQAKQHHSKSYRQSSALLRAFDGAQDLVAAVAQRGVTVVLATSAAPDELELLRSVLGIDDAVAEITADEDVQAAKPEPDLIQVALQQAGVTADRAVYVGDTVWDVKACGKAGVVCVGVLSGGISAAELTEAGAVAVYQDCQTLLRELDTSPLAAMWS